MAASAVRGAKLRSIAQRFAPIRRGNKMLLVQRRPDVVGFVRPRQLNRLLRRVFMGNSRRQATNDIQPGALLALGVDHVSRRLLDREAGPVSPTKVRTYPSPLANFTRSLLIIAVSRAQHSLLFSFGDLCIPPRKLFKAGLHTESTQGQPPRAAHTTCPRGSKPPITTIGKIVLTPACIVLA